MQPAVVSTNNRHVSSSTSDKRRERAENILLPVLPLPGAITCCVLNFLIPGLGTMCAGCITFCCSKPGAFDHSSDRWTSCLAGFGVGFAQLITTACIVGLIWSWSWGIYMIFKSCTNEDRTDTRNNNYTTSVELHQNSAFVAEQPYFTSGSQYGVAETSFMTSPSVTNQIQVNFSSYPNGSRPTGNSNYAGSGQGISVETDYVNSVNLPRI